MILRCQKLPTITGNFLKQKPLRFTLVALAPSIHTSGWPRTNKSFNSQPQVATSSRILFHATLFQKILVSFAQSTFVIFKSHDICYLESVL